MKFIFAFYIILLFPLAIESTTLPVEIRIVEIEEPAWLRIKRACGISDSLDWSFKTKVIYKDAIWKEVARKDSSIDARRRMLKRNWD